MAKKASKITVLRAMEDQKDILFGQFSSTLSKQDKDRAWEEIFEKAKEVLKLDDKKNCQYFRDVMWQNWRRSALEKRDKRRHTGAGGGKEIEFSEADEFVFRIIGKESKALDGLNVPESSGTYSHILSTKNQIARDNIPPTSQQCKKRSLSPLPDSQQTKIHKNSTGKKRFSDLNEDENANRKNQLKMEWLDLQCQLARKELQLKDKDLQLRDLQILKYERDLNIYSVDENETNDD